MKDKRGQMKISFGMMFSIILIIIFIVFAFYAIGKFLDLQSSMKTGKFLEDLQNDVDKLWKGSQGSQEVEYNIPKKVDYVCFVDFESSAFGTNRELYIDLRKAKSDAENLVFYPIGSAGIDSHEIKHINLEDLTSTANPYCLTQEGGKIKIKLEKDFSENLVKIN